jgi:hypothetical protein
MATPRQTAEQPGPVARGLVFLIDAYRWLLSPLIGQQCRFHPTCSAYAREALLAHGAARGTWLALRRLARCHPWSPGGIDTVPTPRPCHHTKPEPGH